MEWLRPRTLPPTTKEVVNTCVSHFKASFNASSVAVSGVNLHAVMPLVYAHAGADEPRRVCVCVSVRVRVREGRPTTESRTEEDGEREQTEDGRETKR